MDEMDRRNVGDDPTIMGYELMNEAQAPTGRWAERRAWVAEMSAYIKSLDPNHLVAPGTWGYRTSWERREWLEEHQIPTIDYCDDLAGTGFRINNPNAARSCGCGTSFEAAQTEEKA